MIKHFKRIRGLKSYTEWLFYIPEIFIRKYHCNMSVQYFCIEDFAKWCQIAKYWNVKNVANKQSIGHGLQSQRDREYVLLYDHYWKVVEIKMFCWYISRVEAGLQAYLYIEMLDIFVQKWYLSPPLVEGVLNIYYNYVVYLILFIS